MTHTATITAPRTAASHSDRIRQHALRSGISRSTPVKAGDNSVRSQQKRNVPASRCGRQRPSTGRRVQQLLVKGRHVVLTTDDYGIVELREEWSTTFRQNPVRLVGGPPAPL